MFVYNKMIQSETGEGNQIYLYRFNDSYEFNLHHIYIKLTYIYLDQ